MSREDSASTAGGPSPRAFAYRDYRFFWVAVGLTSFAAQIMGIAVALQVYLLTHDQFMLGLVGLATFTPALLLVLVTGYVADRFNRRLIMAIAGTRRARLRGRPDALHGARSPRTSGRSSRSSP